MTPTFNPIFKEKKGEAWYCANCNRHYTHHRGVMWFCFTPEQEVEYQKNYREQSK